MSLQDEIADLWARSEAGDVDADSATGEDHETLQAFLHALETDQVRAAERDGDWEPTADDPAATHPWSTNEWVKRGILLTFRLHDITAHEYGGVQYHDVLPLRDTADLGRRGTRNTPDGTTLRRGCYLGRDGIVMSPAFVNIGARVGDGTLVDSCDVVGSCAQIGDDVKLGANTLVGGVLEPVEDAPVVIEDGASIGAGCRITSGFVVGEGSVVGENTLLTPRVPVYDLVEDAVIYGALPPERRAFQRYVRSSVSDRDLFDGDAYKPAVVATDVAEETLEAVEREDALR
jgi:2,3,4,5-tetrahydropyridine-2-carboxylate N-succinyltransferase